MALPGSRASGNCVGGGAWGGNGLILGKRLWRYVRFNREGYVLLVARTRSGKGASVIVPSILSAKRESLFILDPKAENFAVTQRERRRHGKVWALDFIQPALSDCFTPSTWYAAPMSMTASTKPTMPWPSPTC